MSDRLKSLVKQHAAELGFALVGIAPPDASRHGAFYRGWLEKGAHGEMRYLARPDAVARREDPRLTLESVRSIVVVAHEYFSEDGPGVPDDPATGVIARYARGRDYHKVLKKKLLQLLQRLREVDGVEVEGRAYVDTGPILERELATRAGLGWFGKNTMLIHPRRGSYFFLGCLLLDLELEPDAPIAEDHCGTCTRCLDACPTGALLGRDENGAPRIDATRCISYLTIENKGPIPEALRPLIGNRIYGCDICQEVCPWNGPKFVQITRERDYTPEARAAYTTDVGLPRTDGPALIELLEMTPEDWDFWARGSPIRRVGYAGFMRNVAVALGNWGSPEAVPALLGALWDDEPLVREHAAWALGRLKIARAAEGPEG